MSKNFMSYGDAETVLSGYAEAIKSLDPEGGDLDTRLTAVENELYSHFTINAYNATVIKISGFKVNASSASGETFLLRQRGSECIILTFGNNTQDTILGTNYRAVRLYGGIGGTSKITSLQFDYTNRDLYITVGGFGALSFSQIGGQKDTLTYETGATVPDTNIYNISIVDIATLTDLSTVHNLKGGAYTTIEDNTDLDTIITAGTYGVDLAAHAQTLVNCPANSSFKMLVDIGAAAQTVRQTIIVTNEQNAPIYTRSRSTASEFGSWQKLLTTSDLTSSVTSGSTAPVTSGGVYEATKEVIGTLDSAARVWTGYIPYYGTRRFTVSIYTSGSSGVYDFYFRPYQALQKVVHMAGTDQSPTFTCTSLGGNMWQITASISGQTVTTCYII